MSDALSALTSTPHATLLGELVQAVRAQSAFRFVEIGCSVARGAADEMSDIDVALGIADDNWPDALVALPPILRSVSVASEWATPEQIREWSFLGWLALADLDKYLRRGSPWEALARLGLARDYLWRLWAVVLEARYPAFGLTSVLDHESPRLPDGIEQTIAGLELDELRAASDQLGSASESHLAPGGDAARCRTSARDGEVRS